MLAARFAPEIFRYDMLVVGGVLLLYAATAWIRHRIAQAELKTREQLLEIELSPQMIGGELPSSGKGGLPLTRQPPWEPFSLERLER
jgi:hypothetical protein